MWCSVNIEDQFTDPTRKANEILTEFLYYFAPPQMLLPANAGIEDTMKLYIKIITQVSQIACWRQGNLPFHMHLSNCTRQFNAAQATLKILYREIDLLKIRQDPFDYLEEVAADSFHSSLSWIELSNKLRPRRLDSFTGISKLAQSERKRLLRHRPCSSCRQYTPHDQSVCKPYSKPVWDVCYTDAQKFLRVLRYELTNFPIRKDPRVKEYLARLKLRATSRVATKR